MTNEIFGRYLPYRIIKRRQTDDRSDAASGGDVHEEVRPAVRVRHRSAGGRAPPAAQTGATTSAQNSAPTNGPGQEVSSNQSSGYAPDIVVTAQRQSQRLQDVPIAVTAFTADNLEKQQVVNSLALQQTLPNTTFTRGNFGGNTFTIRGVGDLCVGVTCDSATGIHINDQPLLGSRILDFEFFDLERIEVLRGPQGTLFGRNATSGVVNLITAKPDLSGIRAAGEFEYGNYDSKRVRGMINVPLTETIGVRVAGTYLNRDGFTRNTYTGAASTVATCTRCAAPCHGSPARTRASTSSRTTARKTTTARAFKSSSAIVIPAAYWVARPTDSASTR
ncbi:MAG: TonB-dependent receptor [Sphingomonas phyllosphaerae]